MVTIWVLFGVLVTLAVIGAIKLHRAMVEQDLARKRWLASRQSNGMDGIKNIRRK